MGVGLAMTLKAIQGGSGAGAVVANPVEPYPFTPKFEAQVAVLAVASREFYSRIGALLNPKCFTTPEAINLVKAAQAIGADLGEGPSSPTAAIQRLRSWREDGKLTQEQVESAMDYIDNAEDAGLLSIEEVINEVAALLKKRSRRDTARKFIDATAKNGDFGKLAQEAEAIDRIGQKRITSGEGLHASLFDEIVADNNAERFPTGCMELDNLILGGLPRGYTLFLGREKSGKSMVLSSIACSALWNGKNVAIATLELEPRKQLERIIANLCDAPIHDVQRGNQEVRRRYALIGSQLGNIKVSRFSPDTPVQDILRWVEQVTAEMGSLDLLVVDYADLVGAGKTSKEADTYRDAKVVGNAFRDHALRQGYVTISATQGKRGSGTSKPLDMDDVADSQHKVRVADLVIAMRMDGEDKSLVDWYVLLNRDGTDRIGTGVLPTTRECAHMFPVNRAVPW